MHLEWNQHYDRLFSKPSIELKLKLYIFANPYGRQLRSIGD